VDGVRGSDAAHKAAADASDTDRFIIIDADNIPDPNFFNAQLTLDDSSRDCVFRWRGRNHINGLLYGNGGLSCWTKEFVYNMRTHEASDGADDTAVEFCFDPKYWAMNDCYSTTYPNGSPFQAWRAGFREGVKMCLDRGTKPTLDEFEKRIHHRNYDHLSIWHNVGRDVENGAWAMMGARMGTCYTMLEPNWDYRQVQDFEYLKQLWELTLEADPLLTKLGEDLKTRLGLPIVELDADQSKFFKHHYGSQFKNKGIMARE
jgi:hypothetical protein